MSNNSNKRLILTLLSICTITLVALLVQSIQVYRLGQKVTEMELANAYYANLNPGNPTTPFDSFYSFNPFNPVDPVTTRRQLQSQFDSMFESFFANGIGTTRQWDSLSSVSPKIEVRENSNAYEIVIETPTDSDVELATNIEDNTVQLKGSVSYKGANKYGSLNSSFTSSSEFSRSIPLAKPVDPFSIRTDKNSETIVITLPKV